MAIISRAQTAKLARLSRHPGNGGARRPRRIPLGKSARLNEAPQQELAPHRGHDPDHFSGLSPADCAARVVFPLFSAVYQFSCVLVREIRQNFRNTVYVAYKHEFSHRRGAGLCNAEIITRPSPNGASFIRRKRRGIARGSDFRAFIGNVTNGVLWRGAVAPERRKYISDD